MNNTSSRYTPINDSDPFCISVWVSFCIFGIDPDIVTKKLGIEPSSQQKIAVPRLLPNGKQEIGKINNWILRSRDHVQSRDIRRHLDWVLEKIDPAISELRALQNLPEIKMVMSGSYLSKEEGGGSIAIWPEQMVRMAEANLEFSIDIIFSGKEDNN
jgi:hypothetical protein